MEKQLVQALRGDLNLICNEAKKRYPAVREVRLDLQRVYVCGSVHVCITQCMSWGGIRHSETVHVDM